MQRFPSTISPRPRDNQQPCPYVCSPSHPAPLHPAAPQAGLAAALLEARVRRLAELLAPQVSETRARVEKRQAQTYEELVAEQEEAAAEAAPEADSDEEEYIYNPLKLPLGWDGKPIPYWLYKLHGLNQEFKCEICGNYRCGAGRGEAVSAARTLSAVCCPWLGTPPRRCFAVHSSAACCPHCLRRSARLPVVLTSHGAFSAVTGAAALSNATSASGATSTA